MGTLFCKKNKDIQNTESLKEFYCPNCEEKPLEIAEILRIHPDSGKIVLECPKKEEEHFLNIKDCIQKREDSSNIDNVKCGYSDCKNKNNPNEEQKNNVYCPECHCFLCQDCIKEDEIKNKESRQKRIGEIKNKSRCGFWCFWRLSCVNDNKHPDKCIHIHIKQDDLSIKCFNHGLTTDQYCQECQKYICVKCSEKYHCRHDIINISKIKTKVEKAKKIINENNKTLEKMKEFLKLVQNSYETNIDNNIYKKNIVNVAQSIKNEEKRDNSDIDLAIYKLRQKNKNKLKAQ